MHDSIHYLEIMMQTLSILQLACEKRPVHEKLWLLIILEAYVGDLVSFARMQRNTQAVVHLYTRMCIHAQLCMLTTLDI